MSSLLKIDKELLKIICPGITERELEIEYDIYNGITLSMKAKNRYPISEEEIDELIEKQNLIKILYAMDGNSYLNDLNISENVISYLDSLSIPMKKIRIKKVKLINSKPKTKGKEMITKNSIFCLKNRKLLRGICHYIALHPDSYKSKRIIQCIEEQGKSL